MSGKPEYYVNVENSILEEGHQKNSLREHHGEFKRYKPIYKARPANYYPNSCKDRCIQFCMLIPAWIMCGVLLYLFTWIGMKNTTTFGYVCIAVWALYIIIIGKSKCNYKSLLFIMDHKIE